MDRYSIRKLLDTCFIAKKITETMPKLPEGLKPRHIHVIDCIAEMTVDNNIVCVSDVSGRLNITTPSVTKLINELVDKKIINKNIVNGDKRAVSLTLTELGVTYYKHYVVDYHNKLAYELKGLTLEDSSMTINTIEKLYEAVKNIEKVVNLNE